MTTVQKLKSGLIAVLAIDPGRTTGISSAYVDLKPTLKESLLGAKKKKTVEVSGEFASQGLKIAGVMNRFVYIANVENGIGLNMIHIVFEDFVLRRRKDGGATGDLTSCWVAGAAVGSYYTTPIEIPEKAWKNVSIHYQQPSEAKRITNERLKMYNLYIAGSEHKRDANRHLAQLVDKILA